jgi:uncharacterized membrane protein YczE
MNKAARYIRRIIGLLFGLFLAALGSYFSIQANIGLAPWEAFSTGISYVTGVTYGNIVVLTGFLFVLLDWRLGEKIGVGTLLNAICVGKFVDLFQYLELVPLLQNRLAGFGVLLLGQVLLAIGTLCYMRAGMGCGPRDSLMVALRRQFSRLPIGAIRWMIEGIALLTGWQLGAKVGFGTVIAVVSIGPILQAVFYLFEFDATKVQHEGMLDVVHQWQKMKERKT